MSAGGKAPQSGLVDMGDIGFYKNPSELLTFTISDLEKYPGSFSEIVLNVTWAQLQAAEDGPIDTLFINDAIRQVEHYNNTHQGSDLGIKLRVWGGFTAPDWAKNIDGPPLTITGEGPDVLTIGRFWTADYIDAWTSFQNALATLYDGNPVIRGISNTAGGSGSDEPFVPLKGGVGPLQAVGYTDAAQELTLRAAIADYSQWSTTPLDYTMNLFHLFDGGSESSDANFTLAVLQQARNSARLVQAGNHALNSSWPTSDAFIYAQMQADAALDPATVPGSFQTASPAVLGLIPLPPPTGYPTFTGAYTQWPYAVAQGVAANAGDIELWDGPGQTGFLGLIQSQVQTLAGILAAGTPPTTGAPADGSALGFIAPAFVAGGPGTVAFSGTDAVLLAGATAQNAYSVTLTSMNGGTLAVTDFYGIVFGPTSGPTLALSGPLPQVNTVLASLTDTLQSGNDIVQIAVTDSSGNNAVREVGVQISAPAASSGGTFVAGPSGAGDLAVAAQLADNGILLVGGVQKSVVIPGNLEIGAAGGSNTLLAALAPSAYSTASLSIGGTLDVQSGGTAYFTGTLSAAAVTVDSGGAISGNGTLTASAGGSIVNDGTIEAAVDLTLGLQRLTVANTLLGSGKLVIDPGATATLRAEVSATQTIEFAPNSIAQFANDPYSPSTLVMEAPEEMRGAISGFSFADRLVLHGVAATSVSYDGSTLIVDEVAGFLPFSLSGNLAGFTPSFSVVGAGADATTIITFVASPDHRPRVVAPTTLEGAAGTAVLVPDIVLETPLTASVSVTLRADTGLLTADAFGNATVSFLTDGALFVSGTLGAVERTLQTLTYKGAAGQATDTITIAVSDQPGIFGPLALINVHNNSAPAQFDWASSNSGSFGDPTNWTVAGSSGPTAPGGANVAAFGPGTYTVSGNGAVGAILALGTTTLTGQVTAQGVGSDALTVDVGGALTLAGGAQLTAQGQAIVGAVGPGLLTVMGGALELTGASTADALVIGEIFGSNGTVVNLEQITANGTVVVGQGGSGTLALLGVASSLSDGAAVIGQASGAHGTVTVNGGYWANGIEGLTSGQLTVGGAGTGSLLINGMANGITGQVTAFNATIGAQGGSQGSVALDGGDLLVANISASSSILTVGAAGTGSLTIENGSEVAVGAAAAGYNGELVVGGTAGGRGRILIGDLSALLVYGNATVGGVAGDGDVTVGSGGDDAALFATYGTLAINGTGQVALGGDDATLRASILDIDSGGLVSGSGTLSGLGGGNHTVMLAYIDNDGSIVASGGDLLLYGSVTGSGGLSVDTGATLTVQAAVGAGQTLGFGWNAHAVLNDPRAFAGTIAGFGSDDALKLASTQASSATWSDGVLTLDTDSGAIYLRVTGTYASNAFTVRADGLGGTDVVLAGGYGDVHMVTFEGLHYDFQAVGDFVAVQSADAGNPWQIQIRTASFPGATSITTELAARLGDDRVTFAIGRDNIVHIDGVADTALHIGAVQSLADGTLTQLSSATYQLTWSSGESVTVTNYGNWLDWSVGLNPHDGPGSVRGLLGSNTSQATDFQLPNGTVLPQPMSADEILGAFAEAWRVAPGTSLFDDMAAHASGHGWLV